jgi:hypothetical protein
MPQKEGEGSEMKPDYENEQVQKMMDVLVGLGVLEKTEDGYNISFDFDLTFRGLLGRLLKRLKDPSKVEDTVNMAFADALINYEFPEPYVHSQMELAVRIIRTFEKEDRIEKLTKAVGI